MATGGAPRSAIRHSYNAMTGDWTTMRVSVVIEERAFEQGAMRTAHRMWEIEHDGNRSPFVAKFYKTREDKKVVFEDAKLSMIAQTYADDFNRKAKLSQKVAFVPCYVLELGSTFCNAEPVLCGEYEKHNNNDGQIATHRLTPQAFSHFTYEASGRDLLICDIQGVGDYYTDPQIHSRDGRGFGLGNCGEEGIRRFVASHACSDLCARLHLPLISASPLPSAPPARAPPPRRGGSGAVGGGGKGASTVMAERLRREEEAAACALDHQLAKQLQAEMRIGGGRR